MNRDTIRDRNMTDRTQLERWLEAEGRRTAMTPPTRRSPSCLPRSRRLQPTPTFVAAGGHRRLAVARDATDGWSRLAWTATIRPCPRRCRHRLFRVAAAGDGGCQGACLRERARGAVADCLRDGRDERGGGRSLTSGGVIASALMTPARAAAIVGVELSGILAFLRCSGLPAPDASEMHRYEEADYLRAAPS